MKISYFLMMKAPMSDRVRKILSDPCKSEELMTAIRKYNRGKPGIIEIDGKKYKLVRA